jgi:hypothetical protein
MAIASEKDDAPVGRIMNSCWNFQIFEKERKHREGEDKGQQKEGRKGTP